MNKHRFELIRNKEKRFYKAFAIFDKKKIIKSRRSLFYLEENQDNLFICQEKFIASIQSQIRFNTNYNFERYLIALT